MLCGAERVHQDVHHQGTRPAQGIAAMAGDPAPALTLPVIPGDVPTHRAVIHGAGCSSEVLKAFMAVRGFVRREDWERPWGHESQVIARALQRWFGGLSKGLRVFRPLLIYNDDHNEVLGLDEFGSFFDGRDYVEDSERGIWFRLVTWETKQFFIKCRIERLEAAVPGLGETLLYHIGKALRRTMYGLTPETGLYFCSHMNWMGEFDEEYAIAEIGDDDPETLETVYRREAYFKHMPEWAANPQEKLTPEEIAAHGDAKDALVRDVVALLPEMARAANHRKIRDHWPDHALCDLSVALRWCAEDDVMRHFDDYYRMAMNAGDCHDIYWFAGMGPEPKLIRAWIREMEAVFEVLSLLDRIILLIGENGETISGG